MSFVPKLMLMLLAVLGGSGAGQAFAEGPWSPYILPAIDKKYQAKYAQLYHDQTPGHSPSFKAKAEIGQAYVREVAQWLDRAHIAYELHDQITSLDPQRFTRPYIRFLPSSQSRINVLATKVQQDNFELRFDGLKNLISSMPTFSLKTAYRWKMSFSDPEESLNVIFLGSWFLNNPSGQNYLDILNDVTLLQLRRQNPESFLFTVFISPTMAVYRDAPWVDNNSVAAGLYAIHIQVHFLERALSQLGRNLTPERRRAIMDNIDFRYHGIVERTAWHILNFHRIFSAALREKAYLATEPAGHHTDWFLKISTGPRAPRYKIRLAKSSWLEDLKPARVFEIKALQRGYRYLAAIFPKLLALQEPLANLNARNFYQQRDLRRPLREILDLAARLENELIPATQFKQDIVQDLVAFHYEALRVFDSYQHLKKNLQKLVAAQCAAHLTTPQKILRNY